MSSEWDFNPFTYLYLPNLTDFVLIGLPASETNNPLIIPVAGHELGHHIWANKKLAAEISTKIQLEFEIIASEEVENLKKYPDLQAELNNAKDPQALVKLKKYAQEQCEELFCDFVGLRIFGESFIHTYHYLIGPIVEKYQHLSHPPDKTRAEALLLAEKTLFNKGTPPEFLKDFSPDELQHNNTAESLALELTCEVAKRQIPHLLKRSVEIVDNAGIPKPNPNEADRIKESFKLLAPATACSNLADVINAGWQAYLNSNFWDGINSIDKQKNTVLNDLVLKTIEVMEFEKKTS